MNFYIIIIIQMHIILSFVWHGHDLWSMVYGLYGLGYGIWDMGHGTWDMGHGTGTGTGTWTYWHGHGHSQQNSIYYVHFYYNIEIHLVR